MLIEDMLIMLLLGSGVFFIGIPAYKFVRALFPQKKDPVAEARVRLSVAKANVEAAKMDKEAEKIYEQLYSEALEEEETTNKRVK
jgi:hypothetical protein